MKRFKISTKTTINCIQEQNDVYKVDTAIRVTKTISLDSFSYLSLAAPNQKETSFTANVAQNDEHCDMKT